MLPVPVKAFEHYPDTRRPHRFQALRHRNACHYHRISTRACKMNRIDFCVNVRIAGQKEISEYISLLQRVCCPDKYALETFYDSKSKRKKPKKNSCNIIKENMLKLVFYNKYDQLRENKHCKNIDEAKNILRIEIQCFKKKVRHLSDKFGYTHVRTFLKHSDSVGDYVFRKYIKKCYGGGDFYKINEIRKIIDQSHCHKESKALMRELAETSAKHKSIDKAMRKLDYDKKTRKKAMKLFDKIGICPIVIPVRNKHDTFKNPLTLVMQSDNIQK